MYRYGIYPDTTGFNHFRFEPSILKFSLQTITDNLDESRAKTTRGLSSVAPLCCQRVIDSSQNAVIPLEVVA